MLKEWNYMADEQLITYKLDGLELKVSEVPIQKNKDGEVIKERVLVHTEPINRDVAVVKDVAESVNWVIEKQGL